MVALDRAEQCWHVKVKWHIQVAASAFLSFEFTRMTHEVCRQSAWATKLYGCKIVRSWWSDAGLHHLLLLRTTTFYLQPYYYNVLQGTTLWNNLRQRTTYYNHTTPCYNHTTTIFYSILQPYYSILRPYFSELQRATPYNQVLQRTTPPCNHWSIILKINWWG